MTNTSEAWEIFVTVECADAQEAEHLRHRITEMIHEEGYRMYAPLGIRLVWFKQNGIVQAFPTPTNADSIDRSVKGRTL
jgi:hypothetical protein